MILEDGTEWALIIEPDDKKTIEESCLPEECIISYQAHTYGNYAIARLFKPKDKSKKG